MINNILLVQEKSGWTALNLNREGIVAQGKTSIEAKNNMKLVMSDIIMHGELDVHKETNVPLEIKQYLKDIYQSEYKYIKDRILAEIDIKDYLDIKDANKSERTNVSIKRGYKVLAKLRKINLSEFINRSLSVELGTEF